MVKTEQMVKTVKTVDLSLDHGNPIVDPECHGSPFQKMGDVVIVANIGDFFLDLSSGALFELVPAGTVLENSAFEDEDGDGIDDNNPLIIPNGYANC